MGDVTVKVSGVMESDATLSNHDTGAVVSSGQGPNWTYAGLGSGRYDFAVHYKGASGGPVKFNITGATTDSETSYNVPGQPGQFATDDQTLVLKVA